MMTKILYVLIFTLLFLGLLLIASCAAPNKTRLSELCHMENGQKICGPKDKKKSAPVIEIEDDPLCDE